MNPTLEQQRQAVRREVERRNLASFMNATKWRELRDAVLNELPFPPMFQMQPILGPRFDPYPPYVPGHYGGWDHDLEPFWHVEWVQVRPRYERGRGVLVTPVIEDCSEQFRAILDRLNVPYAERGQDFWIYGYAETAPAD
ncbi:MAG: DUF6678 family protein [Brevundimonas sp.]|uniref:DUF6678 family protein n=1 Tax=Brevundimonas sp. TaxID=1871086 RepID=UPI003919C8BD